MSLIAVTHEYVARYQAVAAREGVCLKPTASKTLWFRSRGHEGFAGLLEFAPGKWRVKGVYVHPEFRGLGIGSSMTDALIAHAVKDLHATAVEVIALNPAFYEARNFTKVKEIRPGSWRLCLAI